MVKQPFITLNDSWPWFLVSVLSVGFLGKALQYGLKTGLDVKGIVVASIVVAIILAITIMRFAFRYFYIQKWNNAFQTQLGTAVVSEAGLVPYRDIDQAQDDVASFWVDWAASQGIFANVARNKIAEAFSGATITIFPHIIETGGQGWYGKFLGLQQGQNISVVYDKVAVKDENTLLSLVKHELSHLCLSSIGIDSGSGGENHHRIFAEQHVGY